MNNNNVFSKKSIKNKTQMEETPYWDNTNELVGGLIEEEDEGKDEKGKPLQGLALLKKIYGSKQEEPKGGKRTAKEIKKFIEASYNEKNPPAQIEGFLLDTELSNKTAKVYHNPTTGETVIAHRGTQGITDWGNNLAYVTGNYEKTDRYKKGKKNQKKAEAKYGAENISTLGHSQGAIIARKTGANTKEIIGVNPASLGEKPLDNEYNVRTSGDLVSKMLPSGKNVTTIKSKTSNPLTEHSAKNLQQIKNQQIGAGIKILYNDMNNHRRRRALNYSANDIDWVNDGLLDEDDEMFGGDIFKDISKGAKSLGKKISKGSKKVGKDISDVAKKGYKTINKTALKQDWGGYIETVKEPLLEVLEPAMSAAMESAGVPAPVADTISASAVGSAKAVNFGKSLKGQGQKALTGAIHGAITGAVGSMTGGDPEEGGSRKSQIVSAIEAKKLIDLQKMKNPSKYLQKKYGHVELEDEDEDEEEELQDLHSEYLRLHRQKLTTQIRKKLEAIRDKISVIVRPKLKKELEKGYFTQGNYRDEDEEMITQKIEFKLIQPKKQRFGYTNLHLSFTGENGKVIKDLTENGVENSHTNPLRELYEALRKRYKWRLFESIAGNRSWGEFKAFVPNLFAAVEGGGGAGRKMKGGMKKGENEESKEEDELAESKEDEPEPEYIQPPRTPKTLKQLKDILKGYYRELKGFYNQNKSKLTPDTKHHIENWEIPCSELLEEIQDPENQNDIANDGEYTLRLTDRAEELISYYNVAFNRIMGDFHEQSMKENTELMKRQGKGRASQIVSAIEAKKMINLQKMKNPSQWLINKYGKKKYVRPQKAEQEAMEAEDIDLSKMTMNEFAEWINKKLGQSFWSGIKDPLGNWFAYKASPYAQTLLVRQNGEMLNFSRDEYDLTKEEDKLYKVIFNRIVKDLNNGANPDDFTSNSKLFKFIQDTFKSKAMKTGGSHVN